MSHDLLASTFDRWSAEGRSSAMEDEHGDVAAQVFARIGVRAGDAILDLGCGNGWATRRLARAAAGVRATGVDVSPAMIAEAERLHSLTIRARYQVGRFEELEFPDARFQRVVSVEALYYAVDLGAALSEALRVLAPGGTIDVVLDYFRDNPGTACWAERTGVPMHFLSEAEWTAAFERAGFDGVRATRIVDSRGPGDPQAFRPSACYPSWEAWRDIRAGGSSWIHGARPK
jgi:ubiquinone/menaquinone biosynthesis C-methylase UbiE